MTGQALATAPIPRVDLLAEARSDALWTAGLGLLGLVAGPIVTVLGAVFVVGLVLGPVILIGGLIALVLGGYRFLVPMGHPALRGIGRTDAERALALREIGEELAAPSAEHLRLSTGAVLSVGARWMVLRKRGIFLARRRDLVWGYSSTTAHKRYGVTTRTSHEVVLVTRGQEQRVDVRGPEEGAAVLTLFRRASPRAFVGYRDDLLAAGRAALVARVDALPLDVASSPGDPPPGAHLPPASGTSLWPWAGLVLGLGLLGLGLLATFFFAWIALHPRDARDPQYGSAFALLSFVVCAGPGFLAAAASVWRLASRARRG